MAEKVEKKLGWFNTPGRLGDRDIATQMRGLEKLVAEIPGKTVLDAGCAEGCVSIELAMSGAKYCLGLEVVAGHVAIATKLAAGLPCEFAESNLNEDDITAMDQRFDVVLMLGILHKLRNPAKVCAELAALCTDLCVIRLPAAGAVFIDRRSGNKPQDIGKAMDAAGFDLEEITRGFENEWIGWYRHRNLTKPSEVDQQFIDETQAPEPEVWHAAVPDPEPAPRRRRRAKTEDTEGGV